jgi:hypothetical protein
MPELTIRTITGSVRVDGRDKENVGSDEYIHEQRTVDRILLQDQDTLIPEVFRFAWGGECRVEIDLHGKLMPPAPFPGAVGDIHVWGQTRFYEGDSEDTSDLEDWENFFFVVPRYFAGGPPITYMVDMKNAELVGGDDWARVTFELKNKSAE